MIRAPRLLAAAGLFALLLTGCSGTVRAGAAATVGEERITMTALGDLVERGLADPSAQQAVGTDRPGFERSVLGRMIQHLVLVEAAEKAGVTVSGADIDAAYDRFATQLGGEDQLLAEALKAGIAKVDLRGVIADAALRDALADKLTEDIPVPESVLREGYQANIADYDQVRSAHILVGSLAQAQEILAQVKADPSRFAPLAAQFSLDTSNKDRGGDLDYQGRGRLEKPFEDAIFTAKPGTYVIAKTSFGHHVIHVIDRRTVTYEQAVPELRRSLLGEPRANALGEALDAAVKSLGVTINPRFGNFDPLQQTVIPAVVCAANDISSPSPRPDDSGIPQATPSPGC